jgi:hypothetical protein
MSWADMADEEDKVARLADAAKMFHKVPKPPPMVLEPLVTPEPPEPSRWIPPHARKLVDSSKQKLKNLFYKEKNLK